MDSNNKDQIALLKEENERLIAVLKDYERLEADILSEDKLWWPHRAQDVFRGKLYE